MQSEYLACRAKAIRGGWQGRLKLVWVRLITVRFTSVTPWPFDHIPSLFFPAYCRVNEQDGGSSNLNSKKRRLLRDTLSGSQVSTVSDVISFYLFQSTNQSLSALEDKNNETKPGGQVSARQWSTVIFILHPSFIACWIDLWTGCKQENCQFETAIALRSIIKNPQPSSQRSQSIAPYLRGAMYIHH